MSLIRACRARPALNALVHVHGLATDALTQTQVAAKQSESTQIAEPVHGEVFTADVVSGAPGMHLGCRCNNIGTLIHIPS